MNINPHTIDLIVDGKRFGMRTWANVPRKGDLILVSDGTETVQVTAVVWADSGAARDIYDSWVQLVCKRVRHAAKKSGGAK